MISFLSKIRKWIITWNYSGGETNTKTGVCTMSPDIILGFEFWIACELHNYHYRGKKKVDSRRHSDYKFFRGLLNIVINKIESMLGFLKTRPTGFVILDVVIDLLFVPVIFLYLIVGIILATIYHTVVRVVSFIFWKA